MARVYDRYIVGGTAKQKLRIARRVAILEADRFVRRKIAAIKRNSRLYGLHLGQVPGRGEGMFNTHSIPSWTLLFMYFGTLQVGENPRDNGDYTSQVTATLSVRGHPRRRAGHNLALLNHCCPNGNGGNGPNVEFFKFYVPKARLYFLYGRAGRRRIPPGSHLTIDYGCNYWKSYARLRDPPPGFRKIRCECDHPTPCPNGRGRIVCE